uniref:Uncharacterized protein n=1 Tax=Arundo donax TaxID=35708 RepID=A0A0A8Y486_ARUDO
MLSVSAEVRDLRPWTPRRNMDGADTSAMPKPAWVVASWDVARAAMWISRSMRTS